MLPSWVSAMFADAEARTRSGCDVRRVEGATLASTTIESTARLDTRRLRVAVAEAYSRLFDATHALHLVRAWNFVPDILAPMADGGDRYMNFNAGRYDAMLAHFGDAALAAHVPAATGVGHSEDALIIHVLATPKRGRAIENPRQTPAYRYSARFGPLPPCFARATRATLPSGPRLLVAGTAAIRGEATRYPDDLNAQVRLTIDNLLGVLSQDVGDDDASLDRFESLRAYVPPMADVHTVLRLLPRDVVEIVPVAALCRADLLIEIEGVAFVDDETRETP